MSQHTEAVRLAELAERIVSCRICRRLAHYRETVPPRRSFVGEEYWRRPVPGFGDPNAWLLIVGLAPAAHGGNRTGRVFTGDESGRFLMDALHKAGFANQSTSVSREDGLELKGCYITAAVRCAPPENRPTPREFGNCGRYLESEMMLLPNVTTILSLGGMAFRATLDTLARMKIQIPGGRFRHGESYRVGKRMLFASYHPSPRNTYTGKLTEDMLTDLLMKIREKNSGDSR